MTWWKAIEEHVAEREGDVPDPWADRSFSDGGLTAAQAEFLAGLDDQPRPPRLLRPGGYRSDDADPEVGGVETGNSPGDEEVPPGVPSPS